MSNMVPGSRPGEGHRAMRQSSYGFDGAQMSIPNPQSTDDAKSRSDAQSNLLGLLKFASPSPTPPAAPKSVQAPSSSSKPSLNPHSRGISASDLVASLRGGGAMSPTANQAAPRSSSTSHQESLLRLLNEQSAVEESKSSTSRKAQSPLPESAASRDSPSVRVFGSKEATPTAFSPENIPQSSPRKGTPIFTYVNPFDQLAASSPLNAAEKTQPELSHKAPKPPSPINAPNLPRGLKASRDDALQSIETPDIPQQTDHSSTTAALKNLGAPTQNTETVAEALNEVGEKVHKQIEQALAEADHSYSDTASKRTKIEEASHSPEKVPTVKETSTVPDESTDHGIVTYQIPMRPFVVIDIKKTEAGAVIRESCIVHIARFRKDFDQIDRTLASATKDFIVYGVIKNGGIRVIQQDIGSSSLQFPNTDDRIFNVSISSSTTRPGRQSVIGTGVSGAVYWTLLVDKTGELSQLEIEDFSVTFPPAQSPADSTSNGQLKTRAKKSNRHPEFFAVGRGKSIQIVFPLHARKSQHLGRNSTLATEAYFADRNLKVNTGKTGKDFAFSEDDTVIATLDKAGKLRLWDIKDLVHPDNETASILAPIEVKTPVLSYSTCDGSEKSWPTSVLFIDKSRSYQKGIAQRYVLVGMKQNHTLQLWDLCLGKAVQELSFPHEGESDAICSVAFHPDSSVIVVGHPTRNSIYVIQLSAPKFHLPGISQAKLINRIANKDPSLPKTDATAIMSNFREFSFASIGQLRSLDLAPPCEDSIRDNSYLFELYIMHSKGVTCLGFAKEDLGWSSAGKTLHPVDAQQDNVIALRDLRETPVGSIAGASSSNGESAAATSSKVPSKAAVKDAEKLERKSTPVKSVEKIENKRLRQEVGPEAAFKPAVDATKPANATPSQGPPKSTTTNGLKEVPPQTPSKSSTQTLTEPTTGGNSEVKPFADGQAISLGISSDLLDSEMRKIQEGVSTVLKSSISSELEKLHRRLDNDKQVQNATIGANQEAILRLVSKQLGDNVEKSLALIVSKSVKESVTPSVTETTANTLEKTLPNELGQQMENLLPVHLKAALSDAVSRTLQSKEFTKIVSEQVSKGITGHVEKEVIGTLQKSILPKFQNMIVDLAKEQSRDKELQIRTLLQQFETQRHTYDAKIDILTKSIQTMSVTIESMAGAQSEFQAEILRQQKALVRAGSPTPSESASMQGNADQIEMQQISSAMRKGDVEQGTIMWLQSGQQVELFDRIFVGYSPEYLHRISPLVNLSVAAAVTAAFDNNLEQRLAWTETVLASVDPSHPELAQVARKVMDFVGQRLSDLYMYLSNEKQDHGSLRLIYQLRKRAREISALSPNPME